MKRHRLVKTLSAALALAAFGFPATARAQDDANRQQPRQRQRPERPDRADRPGRQASPDALASIKTALEGVSLNDDQKAKAKEILDSAKERLDKARQDAANAQGGDRRDAFRQFGEISRTVTEELTGILDEDQKAMFRQKLQDARPNAGPGAGGPGGQRPGGQGPGGFAGQGPGGQGPGGQGPGGGGAPRPPFERSLEQASTRLQLSDEQKQKVQALASDVATKTQALHEEAIKQLKTILSEEQFKQFEQMQAQAGPGGFAGGPGGGGPAQIAERLRKAIDDMQLTDDQKAKIKPIMDDFQKKIQDLRGQAQGGGGPNPELREKFRSAMQELRAQLQGVLTPEQMQKLREVMPQQGEGRRFGPGGVGGGRPGNPGAGQGQGQGQGQRGNRAQGRGPRQNQQ
jgi:hypothetical protein